MPGLDYSTQHARRGGRWGHPFGPAQHFIRAETIHWDKLLEAGSEANARARGTMRLEGKDYIVQDGDVMHIRHSVRAPR